MKIRLDENDRLFSHLVKLLARNKCEYCGATDKRLECSHFHSRRKFSTRYDTDNASCLCTGCHMYLGGNPYQHTEWFKKRLGSRKFEELNWRVNIILKRSSQNEEAIKANLKGKIRILSGL